MCEESIKALLAISKVSENIKRRVLIISMDITNTVNMCCINGISVYVLNKLLIIGDRRIEWEQY